MIAAFNASCSKCKERELNEGQGLPPKGELQMPKTLQSPEFASSGSIDQEEEKHGAASVMPISIAPVSSSVLIQQMPVRSRIFKIVIVCALNRFINRDRTSIAFICSFTRQRQIPVIALQRFQRRMVLYRLPLEVR